MTPRTDASPSDARPPESLATGRSPGNTGCCQSTWLETREPGSRLATNAIARRLVAVPAESWKRLCAAAHNCLVADAGLVAALPLWLSAGPEQK
jgi:hypothetical protein